MGVKICYAIAAVVLIMFSLVMIAVSYYITSIITDLADNTLVSSNNTFEYTLERLQEEAYFGAVTLANDASIIEALETGDIEGIRTKANMIAENGVERVTFCDMNGDVIFRVHSDKTGDNLIYQSAIETAARTGQGTQSLEVAADGTINTKGTAVVYSASGEGIAIVSCGHDLTNNIYVDEIKEQTNCEQTLFLGDIRANTTLLNDKGQRNIGTAANEKIANEVLNKGNVYIGDAVIGGVNYRCGYRPLKSDGEIIGMLFSGLPTESVMALRGRMLTNVIIIVIVCFILGSLFFIRLSRRWISGPLGKIIVFANKLKEGEIKVPKELSGKPIVETNDEIGELAMVLEETRHSLAGYIREIDIKMDTIANNDLTSETTYEFKGDFVSIKDSINCIVRNLRTAVEQIQSASKFVADGSESISESTTSMAANVEEQASQIADINDIMHNTADEVEQNASFAREAIGLSEQVNVSAAESTEKMQRMTQAMVDIINSSKAIEDIITSINGIAAQTNILAMNASIEAARAGEAGKGFAVVAEEVRRLASMSSEAAKNSFEIIDNSVKKSNAGMEIARETAESLEQIVKGVESSHELIKEIANLSQSQSEAISNITETLQMVSDGIQQNSAVTEENASGCTELNNQADMLNQLVRRFKITT